MTFRITLLLLFYLTASAQLPVVPNVLSSGSSIPACVSATYTVSSATLIGAYVTCGTTSITNTVNASDVTNWFDISGTGNTLHKDATFFATQIPPVFFSSIGPSGNKCVDFQYIPASPVDKSLRSNSDFNKTQPITYIFACSITNTPPSNQSITSRQALFDSSGSGRNLFSVGVPGGSAGVWSAGSALTPPTLNDTNWMVWTVIFDGASSVVFTNGPGRTRGLFTAGNTSTSGLGQLELGTDQTGNSGLWGRFVALLIYTGHMFTNDIDTVSTTLHNQFSF